MRVGTVSPAAAMCPPEAIVDRVAPPALSVEIAVECDDWRRVCPEAAVLVETAAATAFQAAAGQAELPPAQRVVIGITLVDDAEQRRLNRAWRGKDASTNVLAFPVAGPERPPAG